MQQIKSSEIVSHLNEPMIIHLDDCTPQEVIFTELNHGKAIGVNKKKSAIVELFLSFKGKLYLKT